MFKRLLCGRAGTAASSGRCVTMPLRAKIQNPAFASNSRMFSSAPTLQPDAIKELPGDEADDVLFNTLYGARTIELNRPQKLHSLNGSMIRKIVPRLQEWAKSDMANVIIIKGAGPKAFCAGGDVATLAQWIQEARDQGEPAKGIQKATDYFALEYKLDHLIATYTKPYVAFMDGITMGGGVGLSIHAPFRIATERTLFAMPETTIGFFPDVGASFFLPRMPGGVGTYLALTSERLKGVNAFYAGIATHYIHSTTLPALESRLAELRFKDYDGMESRLKVINSTIEEFCTGLPYDEPMTLSGDVRAAIDRCFTLDSIPAIVEALRAEATIPSSKGTEKSSVQEWAEKTLGTLQQRSPTSVYVTLRQLRLGRQWSIAETFQREYLLASKFMNHPDFAEGVSSLLISKPAKKPDWSPASLEDFTAKKNPADDFLSTGRGEKRLSLLSTAADYSLYPHAAFGIPTEAEVLKIVKQGKLTQEQVIDHFEEIRGGKQGVREIVKEIVVRKTEKSDDGKAKWI